MMANTTTKTTLPASAKVSINRCNLPADVLGDLSFQSNPKQLMIDGVAQLHKRLFEDLDEEPTDELRSQLFIQYMNAHFRLDTLDDAGYNAEISVDRSRANYLRILRGWFFDSDSLEGAVIKSWVESRFGLLPRYHKGPIRAVDNETYTQYVTQSSRGLYNTNALEAQLDLLYSYCQYELPRRYPDKNSFVLFRGQNGLQSLERIPLNKTNNEHQAFMTLLLNNISSFTSGAARAEEFGDIVLSVEVPFAKLLFFSGLMPGVMSSEREYAVIGGVYNANVVKELNHQ